MKIELVLVVTAICANILPAAERPVAERIEARTFPSVFQAWSGVEGVAGDERQKAARHDLLWHGVSWFGLQWKTSPRGLAVSIAAESISRGMEKRRRLLELNPNMILIAEIRYRDAHESFLGKGHEWWARDADSKVKVGWEEGNYLLLDYENPEYRSHVAARAAAVASTGVVDGIMLDWWRDDEHRLDLIRRIRRAVGEYFLIIGNANDRKTPRTAEYINGYFMECYRTRNAEDWRRIAETLDWADKKLRPPRINCLETWFHDSRNDLNLMRATTTLSLTHSNGYCLFSDPNPLPTPDHRHNWYDFWNADLGKPAGHGRKLPDGSIVRRFDKGLVLYNPLGNKTVTISFDDERTSVATGRTARSHSVSPCDGDIFLEDPK